PAVNTEKRASHGPMTARPRGELSPRTGLTSGGSTDNELPTRRGGLPLQLRAPRPAASRRIRVSLVAPLLGLLLVGNPGLVHSIDEGGSVFRTLDLSRAKRTDFRESRMRPLLRSAGDDLADVPVKQPVKALRELSRGRGAALVKPLSDVSRVDIFPLGNEGLR